jgi:hypothetical protein
VAHRDRTAIERTMLPGTNEVLLVDRDTGRIYEGLSSNFFCVTKDGVIQTAPLEAVLEGTILKTVQAACSGGPDDDPKTKLPGYRFDFAFPNLADIGAWTSCFITSKIPAFRP